jgi:hypothetical protein
MDPSARFGLHDVSVYITIRYYGNSPQNFLPEI